MSKKISKYEDGDIIFQEGDSADESYELLSGAVDITAFDEDEGFKQLALLQPGDMFNGVDQKDPSVRATTAMALGDVTIRIINTGLTTSAISGSGSAPGLGIFKQLTGFFGSGPQKSSRPESVKSPKAPSYSTTQEFFDQIRASGDKTPRLEVRIAMLDGDQNSENSGRLMAALARRDGIFPKRVEHMFSLDPADNNPQKMVAQFTEIAQKARGVLISQQADLLIWGYVPAPGHTIHLHFVSTAIADEDALGVFDLTTHLALPASFGPELSDLLYAITIAATAPRTQDKRAVIDTHLPLAAVAANAAIEMDHGGVSPREKADIEMCFANMAAQISDRSDDHGWRGLAIKHYQSALSLFPENDTSLECAIIHRHLGKLYQSTAEGMEQRNILAQAADHLSSSLAGITQEHFPWEWAGVQLRLGTISYKLEAAGGEKDTLKTAIEHYQKALIVYTQAHAPQQWAETMNGFAQAALVLGRHLKSAEALEKAINAFFSVLEVRNKDTSPMPWAAVQNNLGSAWFMLGEINRDVKSFEKSVAAFELAYDIYVSRSATRMVAVTAKNLTRVSKKLEQFLPINPSVLEKKPKPGKPELEAPKARKQPKGKSKNARKQK